MKINGFDLNYNPEEMHKKVTEQMRNIVLINDESASYKLLSDGDKKAFKYLINAAKVMNDVALEMDHPLNLSQKQALEVAAAESEYAADALRLFNSLNGVSGYNGLDKEPVEIFAGIHAYPGRNFYPTDMDIAEFKQILRSMLSAGQVEEIKKILSARTMVRRDGEKLKAIDYTEYFAEEFAEIANELECAAHFTDDELLADYLGWQAQALLQNNEEMDILADKHWAKMQDTPLEFTISRENYDDKITPQLFADTDLCRQLAQAGINPVPKDMLGIRVGINNAEGTKLLLQFKNEMIKLAALMPFANQYEQSVGGDKGLKQTMIDADIAALTGDYAQCRGGITTAQNLPNNDKPVLMHGGGRRNVYHRQVRQSVDKEKTQKILQGLVAEELHQYYDEEADHLFVIGHENGHSLGPDSSYQTALGIYQHIIEEHKADIISAAMMPEYVKAGIIDAEQLKKIYTTWVIKRLFLKAFPADKEAHRVADLLEHNYLRNYGAFYFDEDKKLHIDFAKMQEGTKKMLEDIITVQLSKSPEIAQEYIEKWSNWDDTLKYIAEFKQNLGIKPYIEIVSYF